MRKISVAPLIIGFRGYFLGWKWVKLANNNKQHLKKNYRKKNIRVLKSHRLFTHKGALIVIHIFCVFNINLIILKNNI